MRNLGNLDNCPLAALAPLALPTSLPFGPSLQTWVSPHEQDCKTVRQSWSNKLKFAGTLTIAITTTTTAALAAAAATTTTITTTATNMIWLLVRLLLLLLLLLLPLPLLLLLPLLLKPMHEALSRLSLTFPSWPSRCNLRVPSNLRTLSIFLLRQAVFRGSH